MARTLLDNLERLVLKFIVSLPIQGLLKPIVVDGCRLHPEMQIYLMCRKLMKKPAMGELPPVLSRMSYVKDSLVHGADIADVTCERLKIHDELFANYYSNTDEIAPAIVYFHGGGFVIGDNEMFDHVMRYFCAETGYKIFAIDYRKAPEYPFPIAIDDGVDGYRWLIENASKLGVDVNRLAVGGDSAGGNLATVVTQIICNEGLLICPKKQMLFYPTCDWEVEYKSTELFATGFFLTKKDFEYFAHHYHGGVMPNLSDFRVSPLRGRLKGLPSSVIVTAGFDPLRDQGDAYASALREAGVEVEHIREEGMIHGFINLVGFSQHARNVVSKTLSLLKL